MAKKEEGISEKAVSRPILFSGEMVRAILEGRKTQTRRVVKFRKSFVLSHSSVGSINRDGSGLGWIAWSPSPATDEFTKKAYPGNGGFKCPYGVPGDRLWVRETWAMNVPPSGPIYRADAGAHNGFPARWSPAIHMPRKFSRLTLEITKVRVERVQEISKQDALAEGISVLPLQSADDPSAWYQSAPGIHQERTAQASYRGLWDKINAERGFGWDVNPWVWVIEFRLAGSRYET